MLLAVCLLSGLLGWWFGPAVSGAPVPSVPSITIGFFPSVVGVHLQAMLFPYNAEREPQGEFAYALIAFGGTVEKGQRVFPIGYFKTGAVDWAADINGLGTGRIRTIDPGDTVTQGIISGKSSDCHDPIAAHLAPGHLGCLFQFEIVWRDDSPVATNEQYLSAAFPTLSLGLSTGTVTTQLIMARLFDYTFQSGTPPSFTNSIQWNWANIPVPHTPGGNSPISFVAANLVGVQRANRNAFYAGILLGIAAAVAVALLTNVLAAIDKKRRRRKKRRRQTLKVAGAPNISG